MSLTPAHFVRSILTLGFAQLLTWVGGAALAVLLPRYLGDANLGKVAFGLAFTALMGLVADLGTATFLTKEVARAPEHARALLVNTLVLRTTLGAIAVGLAALVVNLAGYDLVTRQVVYAMCLGMVAVALSNAVVSTLQGLQRIRALALFAIMTKLGYAGLAALVLLGGAGPRAVALAWAVSQLAGLVLAVVTLRRTVGASLWIVPDVGTLRLLLIGGLPFFVWQAALLVYGQVDAVLLSFVTQDAVVGWYSAAYRVVTIPLFLPTIIMTVVFPALSATAQRPDACAALARRAVHVVLLSGVPMVLGIMLLSDKIIGVLGYGPSFDHSIVPMVLLAPHIALVGVNMVIGTVLNTRDRQRAWAGAAVVAAVLNPALNLPLISYAQAAFGNGAIGAAFVTTLTELFMFAAGLYLLPRGVLGRQTVVDATRCLIAALAMCGAVWFTRELAVVVPVALGGLVYAAVCLLIGAVSLHDLELVRRHLLGDRAVEPTPTPRRDLELAS